jgi:DHA3 family tetracycline resistance protein-like MFS transporter
MRLPRHEVSPYRLYLVLESGMSFLTGITYATIMVYWVTSGRLNPLQLVLLGTVLELTYFVLQLPTGIFADLVSRRLCVLVGLFIVGLSMIMQSLSPAFPNLLAAQLVLGLGAALNSGAEEAWIADELAGPAEDAAVEADPSEPDGPGSDDLDPLTPVYLRATQLGLVGTLAGSLLSGFIALAGLNKPLLVGGVLICLLAIGVAFVMPERNFRPAGRAEGAPRRPGVGGIVRMAAALLTEQTRSARRAIVAVPGLVLLFGMIAFVGLWSESFDRLWGAFLLRDIRFPKVAGLHPAMWFSLIACAVALLALGSTEVARRRTARLGPDSVAGALLVLIIAIGAAAVVMAMAHAFAVAVAAYLAVEVLRPVINPLVTGWMVRRIEPSVRATALSAQEMFDSAGQIVGGPVIGLIGTLASIRVALLAGAAAMPPAAAFVAAASRSQRAEPVTPAARPAA